jgi:hypothetical protein
LGIGFGNPLILFPFSRDGSDLPGGCPPDAQAGKRSTHHQNEKNRDITS